MSMWHRRAPRIPSASAVSVSSAVRAAVPAAAALALAAGCAPGGGDGPAEPSPRPSGRAAAVCRDLHAKLPEQVNGQRRNTSGHTSRYTAAWGDPAIGLRCGVARPERLTPGSEHYNPTAEAAEVNGVSWLVEERSDGYRFTTTDRQAYVEVTVPDTYAPEIDPLTDLAKAVKDAVPTR